STLEDIPLKTSLQLLLSQRNLAYEVKNGLLSIYYRQSFDPGGNEPVSAEGSEGKAEASMAGGIETPPPDWTQVTGPLYPTASPLYGLDDVTAADKQRTDQARIALNQPTEMPFPEKTPLQDVLNHLRQATVSQTLPCGLPIYLDPIGLENLDLTPESPIRMQLEGVRLKTTLELLLKQLGLVYVVRQGVVIITDPEALVSTPNPREQSEFVQQLRRSGGVIMGGMGGMGIGGGMMGGWGGGMGGMGGGMGGSSTSGGFR
ncbi:MAG TPA: hypothetical protein VFT74_16920, partial [Isosphaeraceae bacterium]|nr:hypothetical protein [Isosphaeraceae bacterium]